MVFIYFPTATQYFASIFSNHEACQVPAKSLPRLSVLMCVMDQMHIYYYEYISAAKRLKEINLINYMLCDLIKN